VTRSSSTGLQRANRSHTSNLRKYLYREKSLFDKSGNRTCVEELEGGNALIFVDLVVAHEITSPQGIIAIEKDFGDSSTIRTGSSR